MYYDSPHTGVRGVIVHDIEPRCRWVCSYLYVEMHNMYMHMYMDMYLMSHVLVRGN